MRIMLLVICASVILLGGIYLASGQGQTAAETPQAVYQQCQELQVQVKVTDAELRELEYQLERLNSAVTNYGYVKTQNAKRLEQLAQWVESK